MMHATVSDLLFALFWGGGSVALMVVTAMYLSGDL